MRQRGASVLIVCAVLLTLSLTGCRTDPAKEIHTLEQVLTQDLYEGEEKRVYCLREKTLRRLLESAEY
jgi:hypothetical protein